MQVRFVAIFLALSLAGCQAAVTGSAAVKVGTKPPVGSAKPVASPAIKAAPNPLVRPAGSAGVLAGRVQFDPTYVVQQKAGSLIGQDGASVLAAGQARLMTGGNSGTLITNDGGSLITNDGGSLISNDGGSLITNDGGSIVAQGGGNIVAPASLISQDGGSILGTDAAAPKARRLLGTAGAGAAIAAAGMVVYARSLVTHKPLEIGRDKDNQPVYAVYTNLKGGYELYLPPDQADNVEVVAFVPGKPDPRMHFQHVSLPVATEATVSDDSSIIVNYIRVGYRSFARRLIASNNREILLDPFVKGNPAGQGFVAGRLKEINAQVLANGIDQLPEAERERIVDRITDIVMAHAGLHQTKPRLEQIPADNRYPLDRTDTSLTSLAVLRKLLTEQLPDVNKALAEPGGKARFESLPIVVAANQRDHKAYKFERGSDYFDFMAVGLIGPLSTRPEAVLAGVSDLEGQAGLPPHFGGSNWLFAAFTGLMESLGTTLFASELVTEQLYEVFKQAKPQ